jgi:hypothetical protein
VGEDAVDDTKEVYNTRYQSRSGLLGFTKFIEVSIMFLEDGLWCIPARVGVDSRRHRKLDA